MGKVAAAPIVAVSVKVLVQELVRGLVRPHAKETLIIHQLDVIMAVKGNVIPVVRVHAHIVANDGRLYEDQRTRRRLAVRHG